MQYEDDTAIETPQDPKLQGQHEVVMRTLTRLMSWQDVLADMQGIVPQAEPFSNSIEALLYRR